MRPLFRAKSNGGITPSEVDRRLDVVRAAVAGRSPWPELPPSVLGERIIETPAGPVVEVPLPTNGAAVAAGADEPAAPALYPSSQPRKVITITVSGDDGTSTICHVIRDALSSWGFSFEGPDDLKSMRWRRAVDRLLGHDLRIVIKREITERENRDA